MQGFHAADLLLNDLYQFTCSFTYFQSGKHEEEACFEVFFRKYPFGGQYVIAAGLESVRSFIAGLQFTPEHQHALKHCLPELTDQYFDWLRRDFPIRIKSVHEGQIVFAKEPIITYSGPLGFIQLLETPILNLIGFASLVATNASRMVKAVEPKQCIEFGLRRAQGPDGGLSASHYACLGGFSGTSNIKAGVSLGIPVIGTMSHAFVTSFASLADATDFQINGFDVKARALAIRKQFHFEHTHQGELAAFLMYAKVFPNNYRTLIDTYDTINSGLLNTIVVGKALIEAGVKTIGIRLDSGDLCALSIQARQVWNKYMAVPLLIIASDDLHEERLVQMEAKGSQIDMYAIGTHIATCKKQPALGLVCKLVALNGEPKMKLSGDTQKATYPAEKSVQRVWINKDQPASFDCLSLQGETFHQTIRIVQPDTAQEKEIPFEKIIVINPVWEKQKNNFHQNKIHLNQSQKTLPSSIFALKGASQFKVFMTVQYWKVFQATLKLNEIIKN